MCVPDGKYFCVESLDPLVNESDITAVFFSSPLFTFTWPEKVILVHRLYLIAVWNFIYMLLKIYKSILKQFQRRERMMETITHSDKHVGEGSPGVFWHIDGWDDPVPLLSPQPIGRWDSLMSSRELDNSGLGVPYSWQHFFKADLKQKSQPCHVKPYLALNSFVFFFLSSHECHFATTVWEINLHSSDLTWSEVKLWVLLKMTPINNCSWREDVNIFSLGPFSRTTEIGTSPHIGAILWCHVCTNIISPPSSS